MVVVMVRTTILMVVYLMGMIAQHSMVNILTALRPIHSESGMEYATKTRIIQVVALMEEIAISLSA